MTLFNSSFTFFVDPSVVEKSTQVSISGIGVFFMYRPNPVTNKTSLANPGVTAYFTDVVDDVPNVANSAIFQNIARAEWNQILTSSDGSQETIFNFPVPIVVTTGKQYAVMLSYDANEDFNLWVNRRGNRLVGTTTTSTGPSSTYGGSMFQFISTIQTLTDIASVKDYASLWKPVVDVDVKFNVYAARYAINGLPVMANNSLSKNTVVSSTALLLEYFSGNNSIQVDHPSPRVENIAFDATTSLKQAFVGPQKVHQKSVYWPGGGVYATVSSTMSNTITASPTMSNGATFSWNTLFGSYIGEKYVIVHDTNGFDTCKVTSIISDTILALEEPTTFINTIAKFIIAPVATIDSFNTSYLTGKKNAMLFLRDSSANSTVRFVGKAIDYSNTTITAGGTGYSNSDVMYIIGFEDVVGKVRGNYAAVANISTNTIGGVTSLAWSNVGAGFVNASLITTCVSNVAIVANNASTNTSVGGSGLILSISVGSTLLTDQTNNIFRDCSVLDVGLSDCFVASTVQTQPNTAIVNTLKTLYYTVVDNSVAAGYVSYVGLQTFNLLLNQKLALNTLSNSPSLVSRSNEFNVYYANGVINDQANALSSFSNAVVVSYNATSNNDYIVPGPFESPVINFGRYIINNNYTNEHTNSGNALARFVMSTMSFQGQTDLTKMCEDVRLYLIAYKPANTDIQVFARIKNSTDSEIFDDEDWSRLQLLGSNVATSSGYLELMYGFQNEPNTAFTFVGTVATTNGSATLTGSNTTLNVSLAVNDLIKIYDPLFANDDFVIAMVNSIASNVSITIDSVFSTNTATGIGGITLSDRAGLLVDKVAYPHQAFTYKPNDNVVRYYNTSMHEYDNYNILQIKVLLLSDSFKNVPRISSIRGIGLSA